MRIAIDIPNNLNIHDLNEIFTHLGAVYTIISGVRSGPIGETNDGSDVLCSEALEAMKRYSEREEDEDIKSSVKEKVGLPDITRTDLERDKEITKIIRSINGPSDVKTRMARTVYKNMTKIYGVVWEQSTKEYKKRWNIDYDIKVPKRRIVIDSGGLFRLYKTLLLDAVEHYNKNKGGKYEKLKRS